MRLGEAWVKNAGRLPYANLLTASEKSNSSQVCGSPCSDNQGVGTLDFICTILRIVARDYVSEIDRLPLSISCEAAAQP